MAEGPFSDITVIGNNASPCDSYRTSDRASLASANYDVPTETAADQLNRRMSNLSAPGSPGGVIGPPRYGF
jgi:hypothetical protein